MPTFQLLSGARGLDFAGGGSVKADRHGRVTVSDEAARRIRGSAAMQRYDAILEVAPARFAPKPSEPSCACGYTPWPWITTCPRCGRDLSNLEV